MNAHDKLAALGAWAAEHGYGPDAGDIDGGDLYDALERLGLWTGVPINALADMCGGEDEGCEYCDIGSVCQRLSAETLAAMAAARAPFEEPAKRTWETYGFFIGGDPRDFTPDDESCTPAEIENHAKACELWAAAEDRGETPTPEACPSGLVFADDGTPIAHVLRSPYGIGTQILYSDPFGDPEGEANP